MSDKILKVAVVQAAPVFLDIKATVDKTIKLIKEAASNGADIINFPETWIPGYPWWIWLAEPIWGMQFVQRYFNNSLEFGSDEHKRIMKAAADNNIVVGLGCSERKGGSLYISQTMINKKGEIIMNRRKLKPTFVERTVFGEGDGSDLKVCDTEVGRIGGLCCWEHLQPLSKYALYAQDEQIHLAAWPGFSLYDKKVYSLGATVNTGASMMYAVEGQCFVLAASCMVDQNMWDVLGVNDTQKDYLPLGGGYARIYAPDGSELGENLPQDQEGLLYADIDLDMIALAKAVADPAGHYSKPGATRLLLDQTPKRAVEYTHNGGDDTRDVESNVKVLEAESPEVHRQK